MKEVNNLLKFLNDFKNDLDIEINANTTIIKNEFHRGQIEEVNIIIDKIGHILQGESAEWKKIIEILNKMVDSIKEAKNFEELIFLIYDQKTSYISKVDRLYKKSTSEETPAQRKKRKLSEKGRPEIDMSDDLPF